MYLRCPRVRGQLNSCIAGALALWVAGLSACGGGSAPPVQPLAYTVLQPQAAPALPAGSYVLNEQAAMDQAWRDAPQTYPGNLFPQTTAAAPVVDFNVNTVLGVSLGVGLRCYIPQIVEITQQGNAVRFAYRSGEPDGPTTLACMHPWPLVAFVTVPKTSASVTFERVRP